MTAYTVTGIVTPDCTTADTGEPAGTYNGQNYWQWTNDAGMWYLWWAGVVWLISGSVPGVESDYVWAQTPADPLIPGTYKATNEAVGDATVAELSEDESSSSSTSSGSSQSSSSISSSSSSSSQSSATVDLPRSCTITVTGSFQFTATIEETGVSEKTILAIGPRSSSVEKPI